MVRKGIKTGEPLDVDRILAEHATSLRAPATRRVYDPRQGRYVDVVEPTRGQESFTRSEVPNRTHNRMSARERKAKTEAAKAKKPGNRGKGTRT